MQDKLLTAMFSFLLFITPIIALIDIWIVTTLRGVMLVAHRMNDRDTGPEPGWLPVVWALILVNGPVVTGWIIYFNMENRLAKTSHGDDAR